MKKMYPYVFIGYSTIHKGYRCLEPQTKQVYISWHVVFNIVVFPYRPACKIASSADLVLTEFPSLDKWFTSKKSQSSNILPNLDEPPSSYMENFVSKNTSSCNPFCACCNSFSAAGSKNTIDSQPTNEEEVTHSDQSPSINGVVR